jgi:hypothetical protein
MKRHILAGLAWAAAASPGFATATPIGGPLSGTWKFEYSCTRATGVYGDRCVAGIRDNFTLSIVQRGRAVCGWYEATVQMGNHVDDGDLNDWTFKRTSKRTYHVRFHLSGSVGEAVIRLAGHRMHWSVVAKRLEQREPTMWAFLPPETATLVKQRAGLARRSACDD